MKFPIDLTIYKPLKFNTSQDELSDDIRQTLQQNIQIVRDSIVFFTALANCKGLGGHTGGAYDIVPELLIMDGFMKGSDSIHPVFFDEAGHRVAIQYIMAVLNGYNFDQVLSGFVKKHMLDKIDLTKSSSPGQWMPGLI